MAAMEGSCEEKDRLLRTYSFASADHTRAVSLLNARTGVMSKEDYEAIRQYEEKARQVKEQARAALELHTCEHGC
jgi:hypothetical protein